MSLHQSFQAQKQQNVRLTALPQLPTQADIYFALTEAQKHQKAIVELPFKPIGSQDMALLQVCVSKDAAPKWTMYSGPTADTTVLWTLDTNDTVFIKTMVDQSEGGEPNYVTPAKIPDELRPQAPQRQMDANLGTTSGAFPIAQQAATPAPPPFTPAPTSKQNIVPVQLDMPAVQGALQQLTDPRSGFLTRGAFFFFLMRENAQFQRAAMPFSLVLFEMGLHSPNRPGILHAMTPEALIEAARRVYTATGTLNLVGHYDQSQYAMLLLHSPRSEAGRMTREVLAALTSQPIVPGGEWQVAFFAGVATMPEDTNHPGLLLAQAAYAKEIAKQKGAPVMLFAES